jgi:hypothetical protein
MSADPIDLLCLLNHRRRAFRPGARCSGCGIGWTLLLHRFRGRVLCYSCIEATCGRATIELHHVGGVPSQILIEVPANLHRVLSIWQDITWRGVVAAASGEAMRLDLVGLVVFGSLLPAVR